VCNRKKATKSTLTSSLCIGVVYVRGDTQDDSVTVTLTLARVMVSRAIQESSALMNHHQPMPLGLNAGPVQLDILEMVLNVQVSNWTEVDLSEKIVRVRLRNEVCNY